MIKSKTRLTEHTAYMWEMRNAYGNLVGKPWRKGLLGEHRCISEGQY